MDSLFGVTNASNNGFFDRTTGLYSDQNAQFDISNVAESVKTFGMQSVMDEVMYTSLIDYDTDLTALNSPWWQVVGTDAEAGGTTLSNSAPFSQGIASPRTLAVPSESHATDTPSLVSSSVSFAVNLADLTVSTEPSISGTSGRRPRHRLSQSI